MTDPRYSGEDVLAMLEQHNVDPDDLPEILRREQIRRRNNLCEELYGRISSEADEDRYDLIGTITDPAFLRQLLVMFASSEALLRVEVGQARQEEARP